MLQASRKGTESGEGIEQLIHARNTHCTRMTALECTLETEYNVSRRQLEAFEAFPDEVHVLRIRDASQQRWRLELGEEAKPSDEVFPTTHDFWPSLVLLVCDEWFDRVWTYQEILLAKKAFIMTADGIFNWSILRECRMSMFTTGLSKTWLEEWTFSRLTPYGFSWKTLFRLSNAQGLSVERRSGNLAALLLESSYRKATEAKDNVYGLLGLVDDFTRSQIVVDYTSTDASVFELTFKVAVAVKACARKLPLFWERFETAIPSTSDLASWCPDFSIGALYSSKLYNTLDDETIFRYLSRAAVDCKSAGKLGFNGLPLDEVARSAQHTVRFENASQFQCLLSPEDRAFFDTLYCRERKLWLESLHAAFPDNGRGFGHNPAAKLRDYLCRRKWKAVYSIRQIAQHCEQLHSIFTRDLFEFGVESLVSKELAAMSNSLFELVFIFHDTYIFETQAGRMGEALKPVEKGGQIILVPGGSKLHILSSHSQRYKITAVVEGLMGSALLDLPLDAEMEEQWKMFYVS